MADGVRRSQPSVRGLFGRAAAYITISSEQVAPQRECTELLGNDIGRNHQAQGSSRRWRLGVAIGVCTTMLLATIVTANRRQTAPAPLKHSLEHRDEGLFQDAPPSEGDNGCLDSYVLSDYSSRMTMELAGWFFNWTDNGFKPSINLTNGNMVTDYVPKDSYWGYCEPGSGALTLALKGKGSLKLDYGNPFGAPHGLVSVYLNGVLMDSSPIFTFSATVDMKFNDGDALEIVESGSVIVINSISIDCDLVKTTTTPAPAGSVTEEAPEHIDHAEREFKHAWKEHQEDHLKVKQEQHVVDQLDKLKKETLERIKEPKKHPARPKIKHHENKVEQAMDNATHDAGLEKEMVERVEKEEEKEEKKLKEAKEEDEKSREEEDEAAKKVKTELDEDEKGEDKKKQGEHKKVTNKLKGPSLYCFSLTMPFGYEPQLLKSQLDKGVGIFACDEYVVFSNSSTLLEGDHKGDKLPVDVSLLRFSLSVPYGGRWHTALNTEVFNKIWVQVVKLGAYARHDWVVKADPDTVLFPDRLRQLLRTHQPLNRTLSRRLEGSKKEPGPGCGDCKLDTAGEKSCGAHVRWLQSKGKTCDEALALTSREPPKDCGCHCNRIEACDLRKDAELYEDGQITEGDYGPGAIYINNCKFGLHGPVEVLSRQAVAAYVEGLPKCTNLDIHPWGEDKYMDRCMMELGITRVNQFGLLSEIACAETPAPCDGNDVAFHPFKSIESYFACWGFANKLEEKEETFV
mmetsp:Transcript_48866/g.111304  ORF Transcript_48866/g.111304 Transcript_48866/m.111304 type:complete len:741 (+) Transcript_48866:126-2348(+)